LQVTNSSDILCVRFLWFECETGWLAWAPTKLHQVLRHELCLLCALSVRLTSKYARALQRKQISYQIFIKIENKNAEKVKLKHPLAWPRSTKRVKLPQGVHFSCRHSSCLTQVAHVEFDSRPRIPLLSWALLLASRLSMDPAARAADNMAPVEVCSCYGHRANDGLDLGGALPCHVRHTTGLVWAHHCPHLALRHLLRGSTSRRWRPLGRHALHLCHIRLRLWPALHVCHASRHVWRGVRPTLHSTSSMLTVATPTMLDSRAVSSIRSSIWFARVIW
jgi:hypothetical protein